LKELEKALIIFSRQKKKRKLKAEKQNMLISNYELKTAIKRIRTYRPS